MNTHITSATTIGVNAYPVDVEVDLSLGIMRFNIVGLPDAAIRESTQRILTALKNSGIKLPDRKITVNLAPADLKKEGTLFDLPIALGILRAANLLNIDETFIKETVWLGELSLDGSIKPVKGALAIAYDVCTQHNKKRVVLPRANANEAAILDQIEVIGASHLVELINYLRGEITITPSTNDWRNQVKASNAPSIDFSQVKGQRQAKRALQVAAAGRHNILFIGSPGSGKTMLAKRLMTIMPPLTFTEVLETSKIYSISGKLMDRSLIAQRPFRDPHHTISQAGLIGGGSSPQPGEVSLAHNGILFLDELTEFRRTTLEVLRQPLENRTVSIARATQAVTFPASFMLVAALNPCPCGYYGDKRTQCSCAPQAIKRYLNKISGPLLDRIDIQVHAQSVDYDSMKSATNEISSADLSAGIEKALTRQAERFGNNHTFNNALQPDEILVHCRTTPEAEATIKKAFERLRLSMRGYHKILKVARTIADIDESPLIDVAHIHEAIGYRSLERTLEDG